MPTVPDKVTHVYRSDSTVRDYHSPWVNSRTAMKAVERIGEYNHFKADEVKHAIDRIAAADPNAQFVVAREGSPALYVQTGKPRSAIGVLTGMGKYKKPDEVDKITGANQWRDELRTLPKKRPGTSVVRAWWD